MDAKRERVRSGKRNNEDLEVHAAEITNAGGVGVPYT